MDQPLPPPRRTDWKAAIKNVDRFLSAVVTCLVVVSIVGFIGIVPLDGSRAAQLLMLAAAWVLGIAMAISQFRSGRRTPSETTE